MSDRRDQAAEIEELVQRYIESRRDDLRDLIMVQCAPMVERIARRFAGIEPVEDLAQVGFIGLLNALSKFDVEAGVRFNTYATYLVAGEIKHYLRDRSQTIRQPAWLQELRHRVNRGTAELQAHLGRVPSEREIADHLGLSEMAVCEVIQTQEMLKITSLDSTPQGDEDADTDLERLDAGAFCIDQVSVEDRLVLENAMSQLRDLEREVLKLFHFEMLNQTEIASRLGISCNYVSHILRQSLLKLRKILLSEEENDRVLRRQSESLDYDVIDAATGAYTEAFFRTRLEEEIHRANGQGSAVGLVVVRFAGLDRLQHFYGKQSVADFLEDAANFFRDSVRRLDLVARFGDCGFALVLPAQEDHVILVRDRILNKIGKWMAVRYAQGSPISIEISHACAPEQGRSGRELIEGLQLESPAQRSAA